MATRGHGKEDFTHSAYDERFELTRDKEEGRNCTRRKKALTNRLQGGTM